MLQNRLLAAAAILAPLLGLLYLDLHSNYPGAWLLPVAWLIGPLAALEVAALWREQRHAPSPLAAGLGCLIVLMVAAIPVAWRPYPVDCPVGQLGLTLLGAMLGVSLAFVVQIFRFADPGLGGAQLACAVFSFLYVGVPMSLLIHLRMLNVNTLGWIAVVSLLCVVKAADCGAYFVGRRWGRRPLAPRLSPNKTVEGACGGMLVAGLTSVIVLAVAPNVVRGLTQLHLRWFHALLYGVTLALAGMAGDLAESYLKRDAGVKDSSRWLPGLGGVLDILDSLLAAAPVAFLWWALAPPLVQPVP